MSVPNDVTLIPKSLKSHVGRALPAIFFILQIYQSIEKKLLRPNLKGKALFPRNGEKWKKANLPDSRPTHVSPDYNEYNPDVGLNLYYLW